ncbi:MAG: hypothetical protein WBG01_06180 [Bacteroidota bacterium]|jgi:hypothetical protein
MNSPDATRQCLNCDRSTQDIPLIELSYGDGRMMICPQCLPILIHQPLRLVEKLAGAASMDGAPPCEE